MAEYTLYIALAGLVLALVTLGLVINMYFRLRQLLGGKNASSFEEIITGLHRAIEIEEKTSAGFRQQLADINNRLRRTIQSIRTVRFNPFHDSGGNQSFSTIFADEDGNGVVISSLYARERMSIYAKPILEFSSAHELTEEEQGIIAERKGITD